MNDHWPIQRNPLFLAAAYLALVVTAVILLLGATEPGQKVLVIGLFGLIIVLDTVLMWSTTPARANLLLVILTVLLTALMMALPVRAEMTIPFSVLSAQVALANRPRNAIAWIVLFSALTGFFAFRGFGPVGLLYVLGTGSGYFAFGVFGGALRWVDEERHRNRRLLDELRLAHDRLRETTDQALELAAAEERNRLARELHDSLGHRLTVAVVQLEGAQRLIPREPDRAASMIGTMRQELKDALGDLRRTVSALRDPEGVVPALGPALDQLVERFSRGTGIAVRLSQPDELPNLPESHRLALYRAAQEGLTNVQRHSGARSAAITLSQEDDLITLTVSDDGRGINGTGPGFGLRGLTERAAQLGGTVRLENTPTGARLCYSLPLPNGAR